MKHFIKSVFSSRKSIVIAALILLVIVGLVIWMLKSRILADTAGADRTATVRITLEQNEPRPMSWIFKVVKGTHYADLEYLTIENSNGKASRFYARAIPDGSRSGWIDQSRIASREQEVAEGDFMHYDFWIQAPKDIQPGVYTESFGLYKNGQASLSAAKGKLSIKLIVTVNKSDNPDKWDAKAPDNEPTLDEVKDNPELMLWNKFYVESYRSDRDACIANIKDDAITSKILDFTVPDSVKRDSQSDFELRKKAFLDKDCWNQENLLYLYGYFWNDLLKDYNDEHTNKLGARAQFTDEEKKRLEVILYQDHIMATFIVAHFTDALTTFATDSILYNIPIKAPGILKKYVLKEILGFKGYLVLESLDKVELYIVKQIDKTANEWFVEPIGRKGEVYALQKMQQTAVKESYILSRISRVGKIITEKISPSNATVAVTKSLEEISNSEMEILVGQFSKKLGVPKDTLAYDAIVRDHAIDKRVGIALTFDNLITEGITHPDWMIRIDPALGVWRLYNFTVNKDGSIVFKPLTNAAFKIQYKAAIAEIMKKELARNAEFILKTDHGDIRFDMLSGFSLSRITSREVREKVITDFYNDINSIYETDFAKRYISVSKQDVIDFYLKGKNLYFEADLRIKAGANPDASGYIFLDTGKMFLQDTMSQHGRLVGATKSVNGTNVHELMHYFSRSSQAKVKNLGSRHRTLNEGFTEMITQMLNKEIIGSPIPLEQIGYKEQVTVARIIHERFTKQFGYGNGESRLMKLYFDTSREGVMNLDDYFYDGFYNRIEKLMVEERWTDAENLARVAPFK